MKYRLPLALFLLIVVPVRLFAQAPAATSPVEAGRYYSPQGVFSVSVPVLQELGGQIDETEFVVTFRDNFSVHASIACFPMDSTQLWENETRGRRDYLIWFFSNIVQADFRSRFPGASIESAKFLPGVQDGALLIYNLLPGGTMFANRIHLFGNEPPALAKRGNLLFVRDEHVYVLSIELAEKVLEQYISTRTVEEEDQILQERLFALLNRMAFKTPAAK